MSIYVLRSGNLVKIGFSENLGQRVGAIIAAVPVDVEFVGHMPGGRDVERHFHQRFAASRFTGEWFAETDEMKAAFSALLSPTLPEPRTAKQMKKVAVISTQFELSKKLKERAALIWPHLCKAERLARLSQALGWTLARTKDLYYANPKMAVRGHEQVEVEAWLREPVVVLSSVGDEAA